jgi:hypothetical protein
MDGLVDWWNSLPHDAQMVLHDAVLVLAALVLGKAIGAMVKKWLMGWGARISMGFASLHPSCAGWPCRSG